MKNYLILSFFLSMETSIFIARSLAVVYISVALGFLVSGEFYRKELAKMLDNSAFMLLGGITALIIGLLMIEYHNIWVQNWTVLITIMGWVALLKGVIFLIFPRWVVFFKPMLKPKNLNLLILPMVILGIVFAYF